MPPGGVHPIAYKAAKRFLQRLITQFGKPRVVITDKLRSYVKPIKTLVPDADHRAHKGLNNAIEGSHRPTCKREKIIGRFKAGSEISVRSRSDQPDLPSSPTHIATPELTRSASRQNTQSRWRRNLPTSNTLRHAANNLAMPAQGRDHNLPNRRPCGNPCLGTFPPIFVQYFGSRGCVH